MNHSVICQMQEELQDNEKMTIKFNEYELSVYPTDNLFNYKGCLLLKRNECQVHSEISNKKVRLPKSEIIINTDKILFIIKRSVDL